MEILSKYFFPFMAATAITITPIKENLNSYHDFFEVKEEYYIEAIATFYTAFCNTGCIGITKTGDDVSSTIYVSGLRVIAVDPNVIPLRSIVNVELENGESFTAIASDTGGAIKGNRIDILVSNNDLAFQLGVQKAKVTVIE